MLPLLFASALAAITQAAPHRLDPAPVVAGFLESLQGAHPAAGGGIFSSGAARARVNVTLERFQCVAIDHHAATVVAEDDFGATIALDLDGLGVTARQRRLPLPRRWFLHVVHRGDGWAIDDARTEEQQVAAELLATSGDVEREALIGRYPELDRAAVGRALADAAFDIRRDAVGATAAARVEQAADALGFAFRLILPTGNPSAMVAALLAAYGFGGGAQLATAAVAAAEEGGSCDDLAAALLADGNRRAWGDLDDGQTLRRSAALVEQVDDPRVPLKALHNYAVLQQRRGAVTQAVDAALTLAAMARRYGWREGEAAAQLDLGDTYTTVQRDDLALECRRKALALLRADGNEVWTAMVLFDLAATENRLGRASDAAAHYEEALASSRTTLSPGELVEALAQYAQALADAGRTSAANAALEEALHIRGLNQPGFLAVPVAAVRLEQRREREAIELATSVLRGPQNDYFGESVWRAAAILGRARARLGQRREAAAALRQAIKIIERRRAALPADELARQLYFTSRLDPYDALIDVLLDDGRARQALIVAEQVKARTLLDAITLGRAGLPHEIGPQDAAREKVLLADIARWRDVHTRAAAARLRAARRALDEMRAELRWRYPAATIDGEDDEPLRALRTLPRGAAVIEFVVQPAHTSVFVIDSRGVRALRLPLKRSRVRQIAADLLHAVGSRRLDQSAFAARAAHALLRPIEPWIAAAKTLYVIPDGALWQVPFQLLPDGSGRPLLATRDLVYLPSIALLARPRPRNGQRALLAFGNPTAARDLPDAAREVESIARLYGSRSEVYVGGMASGQRFLSRAPDRSVIHIAAHAQSDADRPMESSLLLSDRSVMAEEILRMRLRCEMAVLSACDTAGGGVREGEGMIGLSWAFLAAGCGNTVVAQWKVDSPAAMEMMIDFHRAYIAGLRPAAALRRSELVERRRAPDGDPFYWAPFIVIASGW